MGTRADFYVGTAPPDLRWFGSVAYDGHPDGMPAELTGATSELAYTDAVLALLNRDDATTPDQGWPWPWADSATTDFAYAWDGERVVASCFGCAWFPATTDLAKLDPTAGERVAFPDMTATQNVAWGPRSGLIVFAAEEVPDEAGD